MNNSPEYLLTRTQCRAALKKLQKKYPDLARWIQCEQTLNDRNINEGDYPIAPKSVPRAFRPEEQPVFWLPEFEAPINHFRLLKSKSAELPRHLFGSKPETYSHLVHPLTIQYFLDRNLDVTWRKPRFLATPMASHRTLLVWKPDSSLPPFCIKSSLNLWIGGLNRNVRLKEIRRSVGMSCLLSAIPQDRLIEQGILLLDDLIGLIHKQTNAGLLIRDIPTKLDAGEEIVPLFSLVATRHDRPPRIVELIKSSKLSATTWVDEFIFTPLIYQAYFLGMTEGLVGEMHEQNILIELRHGLPTKRFWHRDLGGFLVDRNLRRLAHKGFAPLTAGTHERHLGRDIPVFHLVLGMYLKEAIGYAIAESLRKYFRVPADNFANLYDVRVTELQKLVFAEDGIRSTGNVEKDLERYGHRRLIGCKWRWRNLAEAI